MTLEVPVWFVLRCVVEVVEIKIYLYVVVAKVIMYVLCVYDLTRYDTSDTIMKHIILFFRFR